MERLINGILEIDDDIIRYKGNTLVFDKGYGEMSVVAHSSGSGNVEAVKTVDTTTRLSMVKFSMNSTPTNDDKFDIWKIRSETFNGVRIKLYERGTDFSLSFNNMILVTKGEIGTGADGEFECEFQGDPII